MNYFHNLYEDTAEYPRRGFVTIATGSERYYRIAYNLLCSYRLNAGGYPFAIICDRENEYTEAFDKVVLLEHPTNSYMDKLRLYEYLPFNETIFIDADCLVYGDIDYWWKVFEQADDFSLFGYAYEDMSTNRGWFSPKGMREFSDRISFVPSFNGGVYYMRRTEKCAEVFRIARYCAEHYHEYAFFGFSRPADEPVLALGMAVCGCRPVDKMELIFAPKPKDVTVDIVNRIARRKGSANSFRLVHWSNYYTQKSLYQYEIRRMKAATGHCSKTESALYHSGITKAYLWTYDVSAFLRRVKRKAQGVWGTN